MPSRKDKLKLSVYGIGFLGIGPHSSLNNGSRNPSYVAWSNMMKRCYSGHYKTYHDCSVCNDWHNFQNFADWYYKNYPSDGKSYSLDKDIKVNGNRIYGPEFCTFVSDKKNIEKAHAKSYLFLSPTGEVVEVYNLRKFCIENKLHDGHMSQVAKGKLKGHKEWKSYPSDSEYNKLKQESES